MSKETMYRTITSLLLAPLLIWFIILGGLPFLLLVVLGTFIAYLEIQDMIKQTGFTASKLLGIFIAVLFVVGAYFKFDSVRLLLTLLLVSSVFWARNSQVSSENYLGNLSTTFLGVFYAGGLLSHAILIRELPYGYQWLLAIVFGTWTADTSAYFIGRKWGKHKLVPSISPGKTWEGAIGGSILSFSVVLVTCLMFSKQSVYAIGLAMIVPTSVILGDITMSLFKRSVGVKDTGKSMPGHGGLLDRIDGLIFALSTSYYFIYFLILLG